MSLRAVLFTSVTILMASLAVAAPETYQLEKTHVDLVFTIDHAGFSQKHGSFRALDATLHYDPSAPQGSSVSVTVETASLDTGFAARDKDVMGPMFLDVAKFPQMRFVSKKVTRAPDHTLDIQGELTLHGVTKPLVLHAKLNKLGPNPFDKRPTVGFTATGSLKRSDFGISTAVPVIGDEVRITIDAEFNHAV